MINIVKATPKYLDDLNRLFDAYRIFYEAKSDLKASYHFLSERMLHNESTVYIAYIDNIAAGFTQIYPMFSSVSMQRLYVLNDLYVDPTYRSKGIGEALLNKGKEYTVANQGKCLILETANDNPAQHLYERLGWEKDLEYLHYTWSPKGN